MEGNSLIYMNNRLCNRLTYCEWDKELMGPIADKGGLEQGGVNSSDGYKTYNNDMLKTVQESCQGVDMGADLIVSGVGQADDIALISNNIFMLFNILYLVMNYCKRYHIELCAEKTKLLLLTNNSDQKFVPFNPIRINGQDISFSKQAEHVGVIRSCDGNMPNLLNRFAAHKKALAANLFAGTARSHRGNIAASLMTEKIYAMPVLYSGLASLMLTRTEVNLVDQHYINTLRNILKAHNGTPHPFVLFMAGSLPGKAILHLRQLSLFSMITRLPQDPLFTRAKLVLTSAPPSWKSWFTEIRDICLLYSLPHPLSLLENPLSKDRFKKMAQSLLKVSNTLLKEEHGELFSKKRIMQKFTEMD